MIDLLVTEWPLSSNKVFNMLKKRYALSTSYQAVHKALSELVKAHVVEKKGQEYELSKEWVTDIKEFANAVDESYLSKNPLSVWDSDAKMQSFSFNSYYELNKFLLAGIQRFLCNPKDKDIIVAKHWQLSLWPLFIRPEDHHVLEKIINPKRVYVTINDSSPVAKFSQNFFTRIGVNYKVGINLDTTCDFCIIGENVVQIYYPGTILQDFSKLFSEARDMNSVDTKMAFKLFVRNERIDIVILRNKSIADVLAAKVLGQF